MYVALINAVRYNHRKLVEARLIKGWSQSVLAHKAKLSNAAVSLVEQGRRQGPATIKKMADKLGLDMADLIMDDAPEIPEPRTPEAAIELLDATKGKRK